MNIEEAKKKVEKYSFYPQDPKNNVIDIKTVLDIIDKIELDQPKPEIPQFVAECLEEDKKRNLVPSQYTNEVFEWMKEDNNAFVYLDAWVNGYTVKKEKLYTVEIPNPNRNSKGCAKFRLEKLGDKVYLVKRKSKDVYQNKDSQKLTEAEIRKDFDWAWQFAKEVEE
ncbi:DUF1642 domain-containing protein [Streptococcus canis]|uniref:DUF1642 domain-containing protein n=1 Tax=Streptococcus canis TaxID=1329 RepID=UPI003B67B625